MSSITPLEKAAAQRARQLLPLVAIALIECLGGCQYDSDDVSLPSAGTPATESRTVPPTPESDDTRRASRLPQNGDIDAGTYLVPVAGYTEPFEITVPDGWFALDSKSLGKDDPDHPAEWAVHVTLWPANYVSMDACTWMGALADDSPSAEALIRAMAAQPSTASSPPAKVMVGNNSGFEFDHSVEGDVDISACGADRLCIYSENRYTCTHAYSTRGKRETYRVVDLNSQRAVIGVRELHESINSELRREARAVLDSIVFKSDK